MNLIRLRMIRFLLVLITTLEPYGVQAEESSELFVQQTKLTDGLEQISQLNAPATIEFDLKVYTDPQLKSPLLANKDVTVSVIPLVPAGANQGKPVAQVNASKVPDAMKGLEATYDKALATVHCKLSKPYVFQDMRPGSSSRTWKYKIDLTRTVSGTVEGGSGGVRVAKDYACTSYFEIFSQRDGQQWKPRRGDNYTYTPEINPKDWETLGKFDADAIYNDRGAATFSWNRGNEHKTVSVRWRIKGDEKETFEDQETPWVTAEYCSDGPAPSQSTSPGPSAPVTQVAVAQPVSPTPLRAHAPGRRPTIPVDSPSWVGVEPQIRSTPSSVPQSSHFSKRAVYSPPRLKIADPCKFPADIAGTASGSAIDQLGSENPRDRSTALTHLSYSYEALSSKDWILRRLDCPNLSERARVNALIALSRQNENSWTCQDWRTASALLDRLGKQPLTRAEAWAWQKLDAALATAQKGMDWRDCE